MRRLERQEVFLVIIVACILGVVFIVSDADAGDLTITTPSGSKIERVEASDAEAVAEAVARGDFMRLYGAALSAPTVTTQCAPSVMSVNGTEVVMVTCSNQFFDPTRLKVPKEFMTRPTRWADVVNTLVGGTRDVAIAAVGASPYILAGYAVNQVRKGSGNNSTYNDSFNDTDNSDNSAIDSSDHSSSDSSDHSTTDNSDRSTHDDSDSRSGYADGGSVVGEGRVGDDNTADPTVVITPPPEVVIVPPAEVVIVPPTFPDP